MGKSLYIAEKPSVAQEFAKALKLSTRRKDGYLEGEEAVREGLIDEVGGLSDALGKLHEMIDLRRSGREKP